MASVSVPVTADMESGYGVAPDDVAETAIQIVTAIAESLAHHTIEAAREFFDAGTYDRLSQKLDYGSVNELFA